MLWADKYRPHVLKDVSVHQEVAEQLRHLVSEQWAYPLLLASGPLRGSTIISLTPDWRYLAGPDGKMIDSIRLKEGTARISSSTGRRERARRRW